MTDRAATVYDLRGLKCPLPVLKTRKRLQDMTSGEELVIETTDPLAEIDMAHFCNQEGHELLGSEKTVAGHRFVIRRG